MNIYETDLSFNNMAGKKVNMADYKGKVLLIVNTASKCGFTPQFKGLENLHQQYKDDGLEVLGFPCNQFAEQDPASNADILDFCQANYGVSFSMNEKIDVNGENRHALYAYLIENAPKSKNGNIKWNFEKFLIGKDGKIVAWYLSIKKPQKLSKIVKKELNA